MKRILISVFCYLFFYSFQNAHGQSSLVATSIDCDVNLILKVHENITTISNNYIRKLLVSMKKNCNENVEFSEFSNETLFEIVSKRTKVFLKIIKNPENIELEYILLNLSNPVNDKINIKAIIEKVKQVKCCPKTKKVVLEALKAGDKL